MDDGLIFLKFVIAIFLKFNKSSETSVHVVSSLNRQSGGAPN